MRSAAALASAPPATQATGALAPARYPDDAARAVRLLVLDRRRGALLDRRADDLPSLLGPGDLVVVNDAATLPASLAGRALGRAVEVRLAAWHGGARWTAVLFGEGDFRTPTEARPLPPVLEPGTPVAFEGGLGATVEAVDARAPRLVVLRFDRDGEPLWTALYRVGRPVQYAHHRTEVPLSLLQSPWAARPWAVEMPSAGRALSRGAVQGLRGRGVNVVALTHAAGLSSTGDAALDGRLPLPERYAIGAATVRAIEQARRGGGRVVAIGTSVVRALEGAAARRGGRLAAGAGVTDLVIGPGHRLAVVDALVTGMHVPGESHFELASAFASRTALRRAVEHAQRAGYRAHELGDALLVL